MIRRSTNRETRVTIRLSDPLRGELEVVAAEDGHSLAALMRRVLIDFVLARQADRRKEAA